MTRGGMSFAIDVDEDDMMVMQDLRSTVASKKGRGFSSIEDHQPYLSGSFETLPTVTMDQTIEAQRSIEGWTLFVTGLHEECGEDDLVDKFGEFGPIKEVRLNLDHRTGYVKGYALVEFETYADARAAMDNLDGQEMHGQTIRVAFAFLKPKK